MSVAHLDPSLIVAVASRQFESSILALGALLVIGALVSGLAHRTFLSLTALFVIIGFGLGDGAAHALHFNARGEFVSDLATVALIVILFRDGLEVETELLQSHWHLPFRKLILAMPLTAAIVALTARLLIGLTWTESFLLGALLAPTDPVLSSTVITNPRVPRVVRHSLNLESGLNDGLALPAVLVLAAALTPGPVGFTWWQFVLESIALGLAIGLAVGLIASYLMPHKAGLAVGIPSHQKSLYALGVACAAYGLAVLTPQGNGLVAVYVAAITLGNRRPDIRGYFEHQAEALVEIAKLSVFVVFGSLLTLHGLFGSGWAAVALVAVALLVARPVAVFAALIGTETDTATRAFMSWFGPKGVGTMAFSLLVLSDKISAGVTIFNLAALTVFCSIVAHGVTDTAGANWMADRAERESARQRRLPRDAGVAGERLRAGSQ